MASVLDMVNEKIESKEPFYSLEFFPPRTEDGTINLYSRIDRFATLPYPPLFVDITWSAGGVHKPGSPNPTPGIVKQVQEYCCITTNMHLTCNTASKNEIKEILVKAKQNNIRNILALRGDSPENLQKLTNEFKYAVDLVRFIRKEFGDYFSITVAGYPYGHPDCLNDADNLKHLKEKVDAGADMIISQLFFQAEDFLRWVDDCRANGINCPIIPGILPIQSYASLRNISNMSSIGVPESLLKAVEPIKDDDAAIKELGVKIGTEMCQKLLSSGTPGLHFYTLNQEVVTMRIIRNLESLKRTRVIRELPWKRPPGTKRSREDVRPIYWSNRTKSYVARTEDWDDFPNGRWGDSSSPAFGDLTDYHIFLHTNRDKPDDRKKMWGNPVTVSDISNIFISFLKGKIKELPWITADLSPETHQILEDLVEINRQGFWTINSQPAVNGKLSSDPVVGWGGKGGLVYQKAYLEFFTSPDRIDPLLNVLQSYGTRFNYQLINLKGDYRTNVHNALAVTWGIFPGKQVVQPTIVCPISFKVWKDEAFSLWIHKWASIYDEGESKQLIESIYNNYYLVNIVDNSFYEEPKIFEALKKVISNSNKT
jgi:methylenetetrahydrofolate reductase (NADPH)